MSDTINKATSCKLRVDGLDCADCAAKLERDLQNVGGIHNARINFISKVINVEFDPDRIDRRSIEREIDKFGYKIGEKTAEQEKDTTKSAGIIPTLISGMAAVVGGILSFFDFPDILTIPILSLAIC